ncbi:MAG: peptidase M17 [Candidatus Thermoplasmatota archaeon]|nr:peptidase M17 [Candidatus Thermoplasmatota archaeon]
MCLTEEMLSPLPEGLIKAARVAIKDVLKVKTGETVLIVTNTTLDVSMISKALFDASVEAGGETTILVQPTKSQLDLANETVLGALRTDPDILISISEEKLGKDRYSIKEPIRVGDNRYDHYFNYLLGEKISRSFWSPSVTRDIFERTVPIDYERLRKDCARVKEVLDLGDTVHIEAPSGTSLSIGIRGRAARSDDGNFSEPGSGGNLPAGETFISPELGASSGKMVFDGSIASDRGIIIIDSPITCTVNAGMVTDIRGGSEAKELRDTLRRAREKTSEFVEQGRLPGEELEHYMANTANLGELGIGLNPKASIIGNMLEDEKVYGTCHIAIGANYDNDARALIHLDGLIRSPTIRVSGPGLDRTIMKDGELLI